mmetsp:Transcript_28729/g.60947  ORF Transcript_28729/g.60947 Transcript_28729/m.60947 type:complete len:762 (+) Transcript_28729:27-2312(+)|eukprot:CAMPEP_0172555002 /NCGR_PEP_ID=MMETSP1067-20121228/57515_1 /TAXON_ID=265564 ORGANISM="Thalassiosira punctigera, Strain Tpunct2005C2" /NCGR_SAMPLE_ID=MMETSP1067 /ASSEMBLY_ACC=CAM_ASM_000444 /LENGTH=761 /DNA_ID=CAMNT_0013343493 /DNA_START=5 /DNA_END=2290 /DNA_ORIENTATION=+
MARNTDDEENERTSLLASSSAPPPGGGDGRPSPSSEYANLADIEKSARRLAGRENDDDNVLPDSDSVNGLLAGFTDDDASLGSVGSMANLGDDAGEEEGAKRVTANDLEFLARGGSGNGVAAPARRGGKKNRADGIGDELLGAEDDPEMEGRILCRSLVDEGARGPTFREQFAGSHGGRATARDGGVEGPGGATMSQRVHESTRALRASVRGVGLRKNLSYGGALAGGAAGGGLRKNQSYGGGLGAGGPIRPPSPTSKHAEIEPSSEEKPPSSLTFQLVSLVGLTILIMLLLLAAMLLGTFAVGPPRQPLGEYRVVEAQIGEDFWKYYDFYAGKDSAGSNGYITYVSREEGFRLGIAEVVTEEVPEERMIEVYEEGDPRAKEDWFAEDMAFLDQLRRKKAAEEAGEIKGEEEEEEDEKKVAEKEDAERRRLLPGSLAKDDSPPPRLEPFNPDPLPPNATDATAPKETFVLLSSSPTPGGPRDSLRLEGRRRFNRGLFIIDLRHMPAGCGTWPAFWLTDEANWPVNGEIDIVEGVNYQDTAKTALHSTRECMMDDVPEGSKTGSWDTAVGIPNRKTGIPDMTFRYAQNCFVYDPHQWINQGCVATDLKSEGRSLGMPLNDNGGGVYALEWDPVNRHIRSWVFSPHGRVPRNLREALRTATEKDEGKRVAPDTTQWGLPYGHFPIGDGTNCPSSHFRNMRLVINLAFCGSVSGNRYFMDCPEKFKKFKTCNEYVKSEPEELKEAYWKIRGVYVYEREWERQWA